jgi:hypothetical protein
MITGMFFGDNMTVEAIKAIIKSIIGVFCLAMAQVPQMANAQVQADESTAPVYQIFPQSVSAARRAVTANGTRPAAENSRVHILPTLTSRFTLPASVRNRTNFYGFNPSKETFSPVLAAPVPGISIAPNDVRGALQNAKDTSAFPPAPPGEWNPANLIIVGGDPDGNTDGLVSAKQVNIYLNCPAHDDSCWGDGKGSITKFQKNLAKSEFITIVDQYVGSKTKGRYPLGLQHFVDESLNIAPWGAPTLLDADAQALAYATASADNNFGFGFIYHVFVPQGTDVCFDNGFSFCYSPDNGATFGFCGYHESFDLNGHHILYSVEPYDPVPGCTVPPMSPTDSQVNILNHETFETITDPDPNFEWNSPVGFGEIGDNCAWNIFSVSMGTKYNIQLEYSNLSFGCRAVP